MNYLAHGWRFASDPCFLAGTAAPDWLSVIDRKTRLRSRVAVGFVEDPDPVLAAVARGVVQHHADDAWFHGTRAFNELNLAFALEIRDALPGDEGFRPSFLGHILVELLLDATLTDDQPRRLEDYYAALQALDPVQVEGAIASLATCRTRDPACSEGPGAEAGRLTIEEAQAGTLMLRKPQAGRLTLQGAQARTLMLRKTQAGTLTLRELIPRFIAERFLYDYGCDDKLLTRLNQIMRRVGLPQLPASLTDLFPAMRQRVRERIDELLSPEGGF
jgi:hypothetical protein